jgi:hypothetical protein
MFPGVQLNIHLCGDGFLQHMTSNDNVTILEAEGAIAQKKDTEVAGIISSILYDDNAFRSV